MPRPHVVFSSSVVNLEHNPIGVIKKPTVNDVDKELIHEFKRYLDFANQANKEYEKIQRRFISRE